MIPAHYALRLCSGPMPAGVPAALDVLAGEGATLAQLAAAAELAGGEDGISRLYYWVTRLAQSGALEYRYTFSDGSIAAVRGSGSEFLFRDASEVTSGACVLSGSAFLRRCGDEMRLESAASETVVRLESWMASAIVAQYAFPLAPAEAARQLPPACRPDVLPFSDLLARAGMLETPGSGPHWEFHDLLFHRRSSVARKGEAFGAVEPRRFAGPPARKPPASDEAILLDPVDLEALARTDPPFTRVVERRRSAARPGAGPLALSQLSEFLYRTAHFQDFPKRPLPGAGARNEIEFYAAVNRCRGLEPGLYHYGALDHRLYRLPGATAPAGAMIRRAGRVWQLGRAEPHVVIVVAARPGRMSSRYAAIAYRNILLDAGIAVHAMYLVATAMGLAPCALGINVPQLFQEATGLDPLEETSIALFALSAAACPSSPAGTRNGDPS